MLAYKLKQYSDNNLMRNIIEINHNNGRIINSNQINFSSNDYLGISKSDRVAKAFIEGVNLYGFGSGSSALVSGYYSPARKLEERFAKLLNHESAIFFNSGYHANLGLIQALAMNMVMDKLCHASIIDGARLSGKQFKRYKHNDLIHAESLLKEGDLLISERVFSMEGDIADIANLTKLATKYKANLVIDDAHGFGILANNIKSDLLVIPLGKALGGIGAIVAGSKLHIDYLRQFARSYSYSTALPPAIAHANLTALQVMIDEHWRLEKLQSLINYFNEQAKAAGLNLTSINSTPIKSILIRDNIKAKLLEKNLQEQGFFVKAILPPTVAQGIIRISISALHSQEDITRVIEAIQ